jgi:hypothetical protein
MHLYVKWEDEFEKLNIEATSQGIVSHDDTYYAKSPAPLDGHEKRSGTYLCKLLSNEEFSVFLAARGHCLEDNGRLAEAQAMYALAHAFAPRMPNCLMFLAAAMQRENPTVANLFAQANTRASSLPNANRHARVDELNEQNRRMLEASHAVADAINAHAPLEHFPYQQN